ncbi:MAG: hypothetical protein JSS66_09155 [Armatimonadetes bacterium]|nr:hypothetical protein [Armatimonadota bacterium]
MYTVTHGGFVWPPAVRSSSSALAKDGQRYCANLGHNQDDETGTYT